MTDQGTAHATQPQTESPHTPSTMPSATPPPTLSPTQRSTSPAESPLQTRTQPRSTPQLQSTQPQSAPEPRSVPRPTAANPFLGHAISHGGTVIGLLAIVLWGFMAGLVRLVADAFGATLGSALIYTVGGILLMLTRRPKPLSQAPRRYLLLGGLMFVTYEASISLSIGLATTAEQSVEVSLVNYLWPTLLVLFTAALSKRQGAVWQALPGAIIATAGVAMAVGGNSLDVQSALRNITSNPLPFALAFAGALIWSVYAAISPTMSDGYDGTTIFFCSVAVALWVIHFVSGDGLPAQAPGLGGYLALIACAVSIAGGYACWGYGMLHGNMETLAIGSYATPVFSTASSTLLLGVALGLPFWIGVVLVVTGSLLNVWFSRRMRAERVPGATNAADAMDSAGAASTADRQ